MAKRYTRTVMRPWGFFEVEPFDKDDKVKFKRLTIYPGQALSLQRHKFRKETWTVVAGKGIITRELVSESMSPGNVFSIPIGMIHRAKNTGKSDLVILETQRGYPLSEDDIERLSDDYGRT